MRSNALNTQGNGLLWQRCALKRLSNALNERSIWLRQLISAQRGRSKYLSMPSGARNRLNVALIAPSAPRIGHGIRASRTRYAAASRSTSRRPGWTMRTSGMPPPIGSGLNGPVMRHRIAFAPKKG